MAGTTCTICLDDAVSPVSVPCGHIHCEACLIKCIEQSEDPVEAPCPTCRSPFNIVTPELRFVPTKYHPYIQSSVRRVFLSPSATVQDLQARIEELEHHVERLQGKNSSLKLQCANSKRDADRLMDRYEAHIKAITNYQENERKLREETENLCNDVHELQQEADTYKTKYHQMKEKYKQLRNSVAPPPNPPSSSATKRSSAQAALDLAHGGPSNGGDPSRRLIAPIPKRPRLGGSWRPTVGQMDVDDERPQPPPPQAFQPSAPTHQIQEDTIGHDEFADGVRASSQPEPTRTRVTRRQSRPLRTGLTMVLDNLNVAPSDIDDEEKDGPSKTRSARSPETFVSAMSSISRHISDALSPSGSSQSNSKSRQSRKSAPFEEDIFTSASAGGSSSLTMSSTSVIDVDDLPPVPRDRRLQRAPAREYIFRGRRIAP